MTTIIQDKPIFQYSTKEMAIRQRLNNTDPEKYKLYKQRIALNLHKRYHSEDPDVRAEFRNQRKVNNHRAYNIRKERLAEEAKIKANLAS